MIEDGQDDYDKSIQEYGGEKKAPKRLDYQSPALTVFGSVKDLTLNGTGSGADGGTTPGMTKQSDPALKENIVKVGDHPAGVGLYLFDYKPEVLDHRGCGRQFGVMADEVERILPEAVTIGADGYRQVDYAMLGIVLH